MCGISAYVGLGPANPDKLKLLGIYNTTRGTDACGIVINDKIIKGIKDQANFSDFIEKNDINCLEEHKNKIVLIHTRSASNKTTKDDPECAHPLIVTSKKNVKKLIGVHNGTITNHGKLAKEFNVKEGKIDSQTMMNILADSDTNPKLLQVLKEYDGAAALVWYHPNKPNVLKIFKGGTYKNKKLTELEEERPLYIYKESDNNYYISSIQESLYAIGGDINSVSSLPLNCLITITPGEKHQIIPINRVVIDEYSVVDYSYGYGAASKPYYNAGFKNLTVPTKPKISLPYQAIKDDRNKFLNAFINYTVNRIPDKPKKNNAGGVIIENEPYLLDQGQFGAKIFYWKGRYTRNGHIVGSDRKFVLTKELDIYGFEKDKSTDIDEDDFKKYYFYQGLLLKNEKAADEVQAFLDKDEYHFYKFDKSGVDPFKICKFVFGLSTAQDDMTGACRNDKGHWVSDKFTPMFDYDKVYEYVSGAFKTAKILEKLEVADILRVTDLFEKSEKEIVTPTITPVVVLPEANKTNNHSSVPFVNPTSTKVIKDLKEIEDEKELIRNLTYDVISSMNTLHELLISKTQDNKKIAGFAQKIKAFSGIMKREESNLFETEIEAMKSIQVSTKKGLIYS